MHANRSHPARNRTENSYYTSPPNQSATAGNNIEDNIEYNNEDEDEEEEDEDDEDEDEDDEDEDEDDEDEDEAYVTSYEAGTPQRKREKYQHDIDRGTDKGKGRALDFGEEGGVDEDLYG